MWAHSFRMGDTRIPNSTQIPSYQQKKRCSTKEKVDRIMLIKMNYLKKWKNFRTECSPTSERTLPLEGFQPSPVCPYAKSNKQLKKCVQHWLNDIDRGGRRTGRKALPQCHFVRHKSHMD